MRGRAAPGWPRATAAALALLGACAAPLPAAGSAVTRLAERGPSTLLVGTMFTISAPPALLVGAATGGFLPAGLLVAPFDWQRLPGAWMDGVVDAQQEDYCTRPFGAVLP
jgi:hypothetical protein